MAGKAKRPKPSAAKQPLLQTRIDAELLKFFDAYCQAVGRSRVTVISMMLENLKERWQERLSPEDFAAMLRGELTFDELLDVKKTQHETP
jgi:hypothetical protein